MKKILILTISLFVFSLCRSQVASNYSATDCSGTTQDLFTTLDIGNIVILIYEHRCGGCLSGATNVKNVINTYYSSQSNIKIWYLDNGGGDCSTVNTWITTNSLLSGNVFEYSSDYASPYGSGMPVIVIAAGSAHKTFLTSNGPSTENAIHAAIEDAISQLGISFQSGVTNSIDIFQNPIETDELHYRINCKSKSNITVEIFDIDGKSTIPASTVNTCIGSNFYDTDISCLRNGIYFVRFSTKEGSIYRKILINR
jgi:hypothetical protein